MLLYSIGMLLFAFACTAILVSDAGGSNIAISFLVTILSYIAYWFVLWVTGYSRRLVPAIASIMACGSILTVVYSVTLLVMRPFSGDGLPASAAWLILVWAIPVKGNIIARSIEQHWFMGIGIAMSIFVMQNVAYVSLVDRVAS